MSGDRTDSTRRQVGCHFSRTGYFWNHATSHAYWYTSFWIVVGKVHQSLNNENQSLWKRTNITNKPKTATIQTTFHMPACVTFHGKSPQILDGSRQELQEKTWTGLRPYTAIISWNLGVFGHKIIAKLALWPSIESASTRELSPAWNSKSTEFLQWKLHFETMICACVWSILIVTVVWFELATGFEAPEFQPKLVLRQHHIKVLEMIHPNAYSGDHPSCKISNNDTCV